jgi:hypothetical protein
LPNTMVIYIEYIQDKKMMAILIFMTAHSIYHVFITLLRGPLEYGRWKRSYNCLLCFTLADK